MVEFRVAAHRLLASQDPGAPDPAGAWGESSRGRRAYGQSPALTRSPPPPALRPPPPAPPRRLGAADGPRRRSDPHPRGRRRHRRLRPRAPGGREPPPPPGSAGRGPRPGRGGGRGRGGRAGPGRGALGRPCWLGARGSAGCARPLRLQAASARGPRPRGSCRAAAVRSPLRRGAWRRGPPPAAEPAAGPGPAGAGVASGSGRLRRRQTRAWRAAPAARGLRAARGPRRPRGSPRPGRPVPGSGRPGRHGSLPGAVGPARHAGRQEPPAAGGEGRAGRGGGGELGGVNTAPSRCPFRGRAGPRPRGWAGTWGRGPEAALAGRESRWSGRDVGVPAAAPSPFRSPPRPPGLQARRRPFRTGRSGAEKCPWRPDRASGPCVRAGAAEAQSPPRAGGKVARREGQPRARPDWSRARQGGVQGAVTASSAHAAPVPRLSASRGAARACKPGRRVPADDVRSWVPGRGWPRGPRPWASALRREWGRRSSFARTRPLTLRGISAHR